jgi:hypothetical protein
MKRLFSRVGAVAAATLMVFAPVSAAATEGSALAASAAAVAAVSSMRAMNPVNSSSTTNRAIMPHLLNLFKTKRTPILKETKPNQIVYKRAASSRPTHKTHSTLDKQELRRQG